MAIPDLWVMWVGIFLKNGDKIHKNLTFWYDMSNQHLYAQVIDDTKQHTMKSTLTSEICEAINDTACPSIVKVCKSMRATFPLPPSTKWIHHHQLFLDCILWPLLKSKSWVDLVGWFCGGHGPHLVVLMGVWWQHPSEIHNQFILCPKNYDSTIVLL
jgi:hypothetical protein